MAGAGSDDVSGRFPPDFEGIHGITPRHNVQIAQRLVCYSVKPLYNLVDGGGDSYQLSGPG